MVTAQNGYIVQKIEGISGENHVRIPYHLRQGDLLKELLDLLEFIENQKHWHISSIHVYPVPLDLEGNPLLGAVCYPYLMVPFRIEKKPTGGRNIVIN